MRFRFVLLTKRAMGPCAVALPAIWLRRGLVRCGLPAVCIDARIAHKVLPAKLNRSDSADAEGSAQLARTGWFTSVHIRSEDADRLRALIAARERLAGLRKGLEGHIRGALKTFVRMTGISQSRRRQAFRDQLAAAGESDPVLAAIAEGFTTAHEALCAAAEALEDDLRSSAKGSGLARRLMTIPGAGPIVGLSFIALVDDAGRFRKAADIGAFPGLAPRRCPACRPKAGPVMPDLRSCAPADRGIQSGETGYSGRVSKCGGAAMRGPLFEAAACLIRQVKRFSTLKSWAARLAGRRGFKKAAVATARDIAALMLTLWKDGAEFQWTKEAAT